MAFKRDIKLGVTSQIIMSKVRDINKILWKHTAGMMYPPWD